MSFQNQFEMPDEMYGIISCFYSKVPSYCSCLEEYSGVAFLLSSRKCMWIIALT